MPFHVIVIATDNIEKNLDVIDYVELAFKRGNLICDITCCRRIQINQWFSTLLVHGQFFIEKYLMDHFAMLTSYESH